MDNRFTLKDLVFTLLFVVVIAAVVLAMGQFSYTEQRLNDVREQLKTFNAVQKQQLAVLEDIRRSGIPTRSGGHAEAASTSQSSGVIRRKTPDGGLYVCFPNAPLTPRDPRNLPGYAQGDWLIQNLNSEPNIIAPYIYKDFYGQVVQSPVLETLLSQNPETFEYEPLLAESYEQKPDGLTYIFVLRQNATFSDGHPVTVEDVVFSFKTIMDPGIDCDSLRSYLSQIASVTATDSRTIEIKFTKPYFRALGLAGSFNIIPKHLYTYNKPEEFNGWNDKLIGSGPYRVEKWVRGEQLILVRNENYWGPKPTFDRLVYKFIKNPQAAFQEFLAGSLDEFAPMPDQYEKYTKDPDFTKKFIFYQYPTPTSGYTFMGYNEARPMFRDKETRRALTMLIDRDALIKNFLKGMAIPISGPFSPLTEQYDKSIAPLPYDPKAAAELLARVGWRKNSRGILERDGVLFQFSLSMGSGNPLGERIAAYIKNQFEQAGIIMNLTPYEFAVLMKRVDERDFDAVFMGWSASIESDPYQVFHSDSIAGNGDNAIGFRNAEADRLIVEGRATIDEEKRMAIWKKLHAVIHEEQPYTFLYNRLEREFLNGRLKNTQPYKIGVNYPDWYVPAADQKYR